jgi:hypothetical protein
MAGGLVWGAVRRARAANASREPKTMHDYCGARITKADDGGVAGCARGGRVPQTTSFLNRLEFARQMVTLHPLNEK